MQKTKTRETNTQLIDRSARYAVEMLSGTGGTRVHAWGLTVEGSTVRVSRYDASGVMQSYPIDFISKFPRFAATIVAISLFDRERWGVQIAVDYPEGAPFIPRSLSGATVSFSHGSEKHVATVEESIFFQHKIMFGRCTSIHQARGKTIGDYALTIKFSQVTASRPWTEKQILDIASAAPVPHLPEVYGCSSMPAMSKGVWGAVYFADAAAVEQGTASADVSSTGAKYDDRAMTVLVTRLYQPLKSLTKVEEFGKAFIETVHGHHELYEKANILHGDISHANLMYWRDDQGVVHGILNDFDSAIVLNAEKEDERPLELLHTGTLPFMAADLFVDDASGRPKRYRHDLEAFTYVAIWCGSRYPAQQSGQALRNWELSIETTNAWCTGLFYHMCTEKKHIVWYMDAGGLFFTPEISALFRSVRMIAGRMCAGQANLRKEKYKDEEAEPRFKAHLPGGFDYDFFCEWYPYKCQCCNVKSP
ncbi:hypothetical protein PLICRDRAFT_57171 [Plicaturopsis crispa FD-325 SS-3]|uniref:Fungal-type protein kinase domain-containing protein n=1 Tax=Plicaturopsis crispa FD-325 SS-3 TaxID=944288 RepID=A0A0C9SYT5_PLICR|nr:hypothetical protein PLICRDRAFT_57171 [Plicaturopsis crispa FD-325 SS-3]